MAVVFVRRGSLLGSGFAFRACFLIDTDRGRNLQSSHKKAQVGGPEKGLISYCLKHGVIVLKESGMIVLRQSLKFLSNHSYAIQRYQTCTYICFASSRKETNQTLATMGPCCPTTLLTMVLFCIWMRRSVVAWVPHYQPRRICTTHLVLRQTAASSSDSGGGGGSSGGRVSNAVRDEALLDRTANPAASHSKKNDHDNEDKTANAITNCNPPKGTRDFYPDDMRLRTWLFDQFRAVAIRHAFCEYDAPVLESEQLYTRKAGEEVTDQLYNFVDKGDRAVALRPEMTPSLARMVLNKKGGLPMPLKWFSIPQCWRYERMTRGRRREHYQWNMDIWGVAGVEAEAELLAAMVGLFRRVGLTASDVGIKINSRLVISEILTEVGVPAALFAPTCVLVDKLDKVPVESIQGDLQHLGLDRSVVDKLLDVLTNKSLEGLTATLGTDSAAVQQLSRMLQLCDDYGIGEWVVFDASVIRGLAYYTGIVFEAFDRRGELRAIAGGGRYDKLLETFGGDPTPAAGFGFGDAVIVELLKDRNLLPSFDKQGVDTVVFAMSSDLYKVALEAAAILRETGQSVDVILDAKKPKWVFKHADRLGARFCLIVGTQEYENGNVSIKDLVKGEQSSVKLAELAVWVNANNALSSL
jgi:histidyl-tRNA synthetase